MKEKKIKPNYSGKKSNDFWNKIATLKKNHGEMYSLGVALQNLEHQVLKQL